jgi:hypothetical protein
MTGLGAMPPLLGGSECPLLGLRDGPLYDGVGSGAALERIRAGAAVRGAVYPQVVHIRIRGPWCSGRGAC